MAPPDDWVALSARIHGLIESGHLAAELLPPNNDSIGAMIELGKHAIAAIDNLKYFGATLGKFEADARVAIERFTTQVQPLTSAFGSGGSTSNEMRQIYIRQALVMLAAVETEVSYLLVDHQLAIRSRTERAFEHLQRLIVVDDNVREKWQRAFQAGEPECEKLGAVHLLRQVRSSTGRSHLECPNAMVRFGRTRPEIRVTVHSPDAR